MKAAAVAVVALCIFPVVLVAILFGGAVEPQEAADKAAACAPGGEGPAVVEATAPAGGADRPDSKGSQTNTDGGSFTLPKPPKGGPWENYKDNPAQPIPAKMQKLYVEAGQKYGVPWQLLAGVAMAESNHGRNKATSTAGAQGPMQWMPQWWPAYAKDGDGDGTKNIKDPADSVHTTASRLATEGARRSQEGVRASLMSYNNSFVPYVNDVLAYARDYSQGKVAKVKPGSGSGVGAESAQCARGQSTTTLEPDQCATTELKKMSGRQRAGQLVMAGVEPGSSVKSLVTKHSVGSVIFMGKWNSAAAKKTSRQVQSWGGGRKLFVAADQEGGTVQRISDVSAPTALKQGKLSSEQRQQTATKMARGLKKAGVNLDLAPVADTVPASVGKKNGPIGALDRQFGSDPKKVAAAVTDSVTGLRKGEVGSVVKHFPGLGRVTGHTDHTASGTTDNVATTKDPHLAPFKAGLSSDVDMVMMSSASYPKLDRSGTKALFSKKIVTDLLRTRLGHKGVVITDDVGAAAAVASVPVPERATRFVAAGGDIVLTAKASDAATMVKAVAAKAKKGSKFGKQVDAAARRVLTLKAQRGLLDCTVTSAGMNCPRTSLSAESGLKPNALRTLRCAVKHFGQFTDVGGVGDRPANSKSDHPRGLAIDLMTTAVDANYKSKKATRAGWKLAHWLEQNYAKLGIKYLIYYDRIWEADNKQWVPYTHPSGASDDTSAHRDHVHVSVETGDVGATRGDGGATSVSVSGKITNPLRYKYRKGGAGRGYGIRVHPTEGIRKMHDGQDMAAPQGTPIYSGCSGRVSQVKSGWGTGGQMTRIECGGGVAMRYLHQSRQDVSVGQQVKVGQRIGLVGATGGNSTGPHLHFTILVNNSTVDPVPWMASKGVRI